MGRAPCCEKVGLKKGRWTAEEDQILTNYVLANGEGSWRTLPKNAGLLRCGKSCRLRWINYLRADLKRGNISAEEETTIVKLHASFGNRWSLIASHLEGRTDNEIKNYWNSHLSRKVYRFRGTNNNDNITKEIPLQRIVDTPPKRKDGRTSRWAMKKNKSYTQKVSESPKQDKEPALDSEKLLFTTVMDFLVSDPEKEQEPGDGSCCTGSQNEGTMLPCLVDGEKITTTTTTDDDDMLGPFQEVINGGEVLGFNDIMDTCVQLEIEPSGVSISTVGGEEERDGNDVVGVINEDHGNVTRVDPESSSVNHSSNIGELHSSSSITSSGLVDDSNWEYWDSVMQLNHKGQSLSWELQNEDLLTWLWDDDDWEKNFQITFGDIDSEKENAMISWFSS